MHTNTASWSATAAIIFACLLWGTTGTAASFTEAVSPLAIGAFAMSGGGLLLVLTSLRQLRRDYVRLKANKTLLLVGGLAVTAYPLAFYSSMHFSGVAIGTVVSISSAPLFAVLLERLINRKPVSPQWLSSFLLAAIGVSLLAWGKDHGMAGSSSSHILGIGLGLVAAFSYALYSWAARELIERDIHSQSAMSSLFGLAAILLLPSLFLTGENLFASVSNTLLAVYMSVFPMFLGYVCFAYGLRFIAASEATLLTLLEPALATLLAMVILDEHLNALAWLGIGLVMLCLLRQRSRPVAETQPAIG